MKRADFSREKVSLMGNALLPPFSARNRGAHAQIDNDCPETTRIGLLHILHSLVELGYVDGWQSVVNELQRIARVKPERVRSAGEAELFLLALDWEKVFDFCERVFSYLTKEAGYTDNYSWVVTKKKSDVQEYFASELQRLFLEENLAFEFSEGLVRRRGRRHTADKVARAELVLGDPRFSNARGHFNKALKFFRNVAQPDPENVVKEAICAVEATARTLFPDGGPTLGDVVNSITGTEAGQLPKPIAKTFHGLYGFRSGGEGVGHGGSTGGPVTLELAEYALALAASQIMLLVDLDRMLEPDVPF